MAKKIKLAFANESELSPYEFKKCKEIISIIKEYDYPTGAFIAELVGIKPIAIRTYIKLIREHNDEFMENGFLVAYNSGYAVVESKKELKKYFKKLQALTHSKVKQLHQLTEILEKRNKWKN